MGDYMLDFDKTLLKTNRNIDFYKYDSKFDKKNILMEKELYESFTKLYELKDIKDEKLFEITFKKRLMELPLIRISILYLI
ncbi:MAG: hypothetical protein IJH34_13740, partial [Romboutsia sp.]|nr:hypothetical protein [Romboutsia sp.]